MSELSSSEVLHDDQSHYEISLTAGQAFVAFVLLLLSLAASFAFGLMIGRGQADERLVVRKEPAVINEGSALAGTSKKDLGRVVDLTPTADDFKPPATETVTPLTATQPPAITEEAPAPAAAATVTTAPTPAATAATSVTPATQQPTYAQLLSTSDQKTADTLAARLIDSGFLGAYVERTTTDKGTVFRVRVRFGSEGEARAAEGKLHEFSKDVWITK